MPLDPQAEDVLGLVKKAGLPELWQLTPGQAREQYMLRVAKLATKEEIFRTYDRRVPGRDRTSPSAYTSRVRRNRPSASDSGLVPRRRLRRREPRHSRSRVPSACHSVRLPGGGGGLPPLPRVQVSRRGGRLHGGDALARAARTRDRRRSDPYGRGGTAQAENLAAVCAILARNDGYPKLAFQLLIYPCTAPEPETPSIASSPRATCSPATPSLFYKQYVRSARSSGISASHRWWRRICPICRPPWSSWQATIRCATKAWTNAKRLIEYGNGVTLVNYEGMIHGFLLMGGAIDAAKRALAESTAALRRAFAASARNG